MPGMQGLSGEKGMTGMEGLPGKDGESGLRGPPGRDGNSGSPGAAGPPGPRGPSGEEGRHGHIGSQGPPGPPGPPGEPLGYDAAALAALLGHGQINNQKGPDSLGDEPIRLFEKDISEEERRGLVLKAYEQLKASFEKFRKPDGQKSAPGKTCRDIAVAHPEFTSGEYWIDPNEGDSRDAILVHCDMESRSTCLFPQPVKSNEINYSGDEQEVWLGEVDGGMKMTYKADSNQIGFLQLLSSKATQNITYHCKNSVAYYDNEKHTFRKGIKLLAWNDAELTPRGNHRFRYEAVIDECKYKKNTWAYSVLTYSTDKSARLPIIDIATRDVGSGGQAFWVEVGLACFS